MNYEPRSADAVRDAMTNETLAEGYADPPPSMDIGAEKRAVRTGWRSSSRRRRPRMAEHSPTSGAERARKWRKENPERARAQKRAYIKAHPDYLTKCKRAWRAKHPDKAKEQDRRLQKRRWAKIIDSYELHEARMLYEHNRTHPNTPYRPNYKKRRPQSWMMHRVLWEYAGGEPTAEQMAYARALFRSRRAQRNGERVAAE